MRDTQGNAAPCRPTHAPPRPLRGRFGPLSVGARSRSSLPLFHPCTPSQTTMSALLNLPVRAPPNLDLDLARAHLFPLARQGTSAKSKSGGYVSLDTPIRDHTVSAGGIKTQPIELGDLANDAFFDEASPPASLLQPRASTALTRSHSLGRPHPRRDPRPRSLARHPPDKAPPLAPVPLGLSLPRTRHPLVAARRLDRVVPLADRDAGRAGRG